jgi:glyoxylase-like metal-dependent hydrolase (beta-lactamase superfamily II)
VQWPQEDIHMTSSHLNTFGCTPINARTVMMAPVVFAFLLVAGLLFSGSPAAAQAGPPPEVKKVTDDLYFFFDFSGSNSVFLVTEEGVLVIDTRTHPRDGRDLLDRIRKVTDKPVKWVINSHFHGDHYMGNSVFKELGATFVAQEETARIMQRVHPKEMARRVDGFRSRGDDPAAVKLVLPDVTFDSKMTINFGGREIRLFYLGPGQQAGDTFILCDRVDS